MSGTSADLAAVLTDRCRIGRQIGQRGMATVYLARDLNSTGRWPEYRGDAWMYREVKP